MAEKKFYWLKLEKGFFDDKLIKKLRKMAGGDTYCIIYLRLILESMQNDGSLYFDGIEGTFAEELALLLDEKPENVQALLSILVATNRVEQVSEDEMKMIDFSNMTGSESASARRVRKCRSQKALHCNADVTKCNTEIELEKEIEKELDKDKEIKKEKTTKVAKPKFYFKEHMSLLEFDEALSDKVIDFVAYKKEIGFTYKEMGFKNLCTEIKNKADLYGTDKVINAINVAMSSGYRGIAWFTLDKEKPKKEKISFIGIEV